MIGAGGRWLLFVATLVFTIGFFSLLLPVEVWVYPPAAVLIAALWVPRMAKDMKLPLHGSLTDGSERYVSRRAMVGLAGLWAVYFGVAYGIDQRETSLILLVMSPVVYYGLEGGEAALRPRLRGEGRAGGGAGAAAGGAEGGGRGGAGGGGGGAGPVVGGGARALAAGAVGVWRRADRPGLIDRG